MWLKITQGISVLFPFDGFRYLKQYSQSKGLIDSPMGRLDESMEHGINLRALTYVQFLPHHLKISTF